MILHSSLLSAPISPLSSNKKTSASCSYSLKTSTTETRPVNHATNRSSFSGISEASEETYVGPIHATTRLCSCGRRHFLQAAAAAAFLPTCPSNASQLQPDYMDMLNKFHPSRPDWYEEIYASFMNSGTRSYEAEIAAYKSELFSELRGKAKKVLEIGIGTGPNLKYYVGDADVQVIGLDPNRKMKKYAQKAAVAAGLPPTNFNFIQAVGEAIPINDASVDAVVGTLVLCSVKDVDKTLQEVKRVLKSGGLYLFVEHVAAEDGTGLRLLQNVLDPLQQTVADGCHLTRETGKEILEASFSGVDLSRAFLSSAFFVNPQVYGIARK